MSNEINKVADGFLMDELDRRYLTMQEGICPIFLEKLGQCGHQHAHPGDFLTLGAALEWVHSWAKTKGWLDDGRTFGDEIAVIHSEASEALEAYRDHGFARWGTTGEGTVVMLDDEADYWPDKPHGVPSELVDIIVRVLDSCARHGIDISREFYEKMKYNETRGHRHGGKKL